MNSEPEQNRPDNRRQTDRRRRCPGAGAAAGSTWRCPISDPRTKLRRLPRPCARSAVARSCCRRTCRAAVNARGSSTSAAAAFGRLDVLINMASIYRSQPLSEIDEARWDEGIDVDLKAAYLCARAAIPHMRAAGGGRIINFSDWVAASGRPRYTGYLPYFVAKRAIIGLTEALALELAADQILVNAIAPGPILAPENTIGRRAEVGGVGDAARALGRRVGNCDRRRFPDRERLRDGRDHQSRWRQARQVALAEAAYPIAATAPRDSSAPVSSRRSRAKQNRM